MSSLKIVFEGEIKKCTSQPTTLGALRAYLQQVYKDNLPASYSIQYLDEEGDLITISTDEDYTDVLGNPAKGKSVKLFIKPMISAKPPGESVSVIQPQPAAHDLVEISSDLELKDVPEEKALDKPVEEKVEEVQEKASEKPVETPEAPKPEEVPEKATPQEEAEKLVVVDSKEEKWAQKEFHKLRREEEKKRRKEVREENRDEKKKVKEIAKHIKRQMKAMKNEAKHLLKSSGSSSDEEKHGEPQEHQEHQEHHYRHHRGHHHNHHERREAKHSKIQSLVQSIVESMIPNIAANVASYLKSEQPLPQIERPIQPESSSSQVVHDRVTCDGCGTYPIRGDRFKCSICNDFDFCSNCEANKDHPHPFLKIKCPSQAPTFLVAAVDEGDQDLSQSAQWREHAERRGGCPFRGGRHGRHGWRGFGPGFLRNLSQQYHSNTGFQDHIGRMTQSMFGAQPQDLFNMFAPFMNGNQGAQASQPAQQAEAPKPEGKEFSVAFVREVSTLPERITTSTNQIFKTILLRNNGEKRLPEKCVLFNVEDKKELILPPLEPDTEGVATLVIQSPKKAGKFQSIWVVQAKGLNGLETIGDPLVLEYEVFEEKNEKPIVPEKKSGDNSEVIAKALKLQEIFPVDLDVIIRFVEERRNQSLDQLIEEFLQH